MKVAITVHSRGIGAAIANALTQQGHAVTGYDITNNYDISKPGVIEAIAAECTDYDIFVNNAYADTAQTKMLKTMIDTWLDRDKLIVNISSKMALYQKLYGDKNLIYKHNKMRQNKIVRDKIVKDMNNITQPHIINVIPGFVGTELSSKWTEENIRSSNDIPKIELTDFADLVLHLINIKDRIHVQEIILDTAF